MTIRAKIYAAIVLTVIGPLVTIAVALQGQAELGDRFDEVRDRARHEALARELKFGVTDVNGWQTAYGYDGGRSRPVFDRSVAAFRADLREAARTAMRLGWVCRAVNGHLPQDPGSTHTRLRMFLDGAP